MDINYSWEAKTNTDRTCFRKTCVWVLFISNDYIMFLFKMCRRINYRETCLQSYENKAKDVQFCVSRFATIYSFLCTRWKKNPAQTMSIAIPIFKYRCNIWCICIHQTLYYQKNKCLQFQNNILSFCRDAFRTFIHFIDIILFGSYNNKLNLYCKRIN